MRDKKKYILIIIFAILLFLPNLFSLNNARVHQSPQTNENLKLINEKFLKNAQKLDWLYNASSDFYTIAISADGNYIVGGCDDHFLHFFKNSSSLPIWSFDTTLKVRSVAISDNGSYIVSGSDNDLNSGKIFFFNKSSNKPLWNYTINSMIRSVDISSDGNYIAAACYDYRVYLFNRTITTPKTPIWIYERSGFVFYSVSLSSNGSYIAVGCMDDRVYLFNNSYAPNKQPIWSYDTKSNVYSVSISADGFYIAACNYGVYPNEVFLFNRTSSIPMWNFSRNDDFWSVSISKDGKYIAAGSGDIEKRVYLFEKSNSNPLWYDITGHRVWSVDVNEDGEYIVAGGYDGYVYFYSKESGNPKYSYDLGFYVWSVSISDRGEFFAAGSFDSSDNYVALFSQGVKPSNFDLTSDAEKFDIDGNFNLIWNAAKDADNYSIYVYEEYFTEIDGNQIKIKDNVEALSYHINHLENGTYYYAILAINQFGTRISNCINVTIQLLIPGSFSYNNVSSPDIDGTFIISWSPSARANNYTVIQYNGYSFKIQNEINYYINWFSKKALTNATTSRNITVSELPNGNYLFHIIANNKYGNYTSGWIEVKVDLLIPTNNDNGSESSNDNKILYDFFYLFLFVLLGSILSIFLYYFKQKHKNYINLKNILKKSFNNAPLIKGLKIVNLIEEIFLFFEKFQISAFSKEFLEKLRAFNWHTSDLGEFLSDMAVFTEKERIEILDDMLKKSNLV